MEQLNLFWYCSICNRKRYYKNGCPSLENQSFVYYKSDYCSNCELRESIKFIKKITINLKSRYYQRVKHRNKRKIDIAYKIKDNLRCRLKQCVRDIRNNKNFHSLSKTKSLGCTPNELKTYLESKFQEGMTWENYGLYGWHIDHIRPCSSFDLKNPEEFKKVNYYTNLQPLWAKDNLKKSNKYEI